MHVLLVEPAYHTRFPPFGLLKLATYHRLEGDTVELVRGCVKPRMKPDLIYVTSLYTWAWSPVWDAVRFFKASFPGVEVWLGGIYASLMPEHAQMSGAKVYVGIFKEAEDLLPSYDLVPEWDGSIIFTSRGCDNRCPYCAVWKMEGGLNSCRRSIKHLVYPKHKRIIIWDNNILQSPYWRDIFDELIQFSKENRMKIDFNQGLDARLITDEVAEKLSEMRLQCVRMAYDYDGAERHVRDAIEKLSVRGIRKRNIFIYVLYNFEDSTESFFKRVRDVLEWGAVAYPMRYEPLNALERWKFVGPRWDLKRLEIVEDFRRIYGYGGTFPPYRWLVEKFRKAKCFDEAFTLPGKYEHPKRVNKPYHAKWQREQDWRKVLNYILSKQW